jgi:hypothetical protein
MSAQAGTLGRLGTVHVPVRLVAVLLAAAIAGAIALSVSMRDEAQVTHVSDAAIWNAQADAYVGSLEAAAVLPSTDAAIWNAQADAYVGSLEAVAGGNGPKSGGHRPIEVNGEICGQCR